MKLLYFVQVLLYAYLMYLGFDYLEIEARVVEDLSSTRWTNTRDVLELEPALFYIKIWVLCSIGTLLFVIFLYKKEEIGKVLIVGGATLGVLLMVWFNWVTESDLKRSYITFELCGSIQIGINIFFLFEQWIARVINLKLKQLFFLIGLLYIGILALRSWLLDLEISISARIEEVGLEDYTGIEASFPEEIYFFIIIFVTFFAFVLPMYSVGKDDDRLDESVCSMLSGFRYALFFSCQFSRSTFGDLNLSGTITASQIFSIGSLVLIIVYAFILSVKVQYKEPEIDHNSDVLDDSFLKKSS
jgi:hypothetical protein